jgi:hypothetical protein
MSRLDGRYADVQQDKMGLPSGFTARGERSVIHVTGVAEHHREWIGVLEGEPERDVWRVETPRGTCELHQLRHPTAEEDDPYGDWLIFRWDD